MWFRHRTAAGPDIETLSAAAAADEATLRERFWRKVGRLAARLPFAEDLLAAHYCAFDRQTPLQVKAVPCSRPSPISSRPRT